MKKKPRLRLISRQRATSIIPHINSGGCGIVALEMAKYINKIYPDEAQIVYGYAYSSSTLHDIRAGLPAACAHALVLFRGKYYDSGGVFTKKQVQEEGIQHFVPITLELAARCITHDKRWNNMFNKQKYTPIIQDIFKED